MALEDLTGTKYIDSLDENNPAAGDNVSEGDDHIRGIKNTIKKTFPNINGAVNASDEELNYVDGVTSNIQTQLDGKQATLSSGDITATELAVTGDGTSGQYLASDGDGTMTWTDIPAGYSDSDVDSHLSGGTGITYSSGAISVTDDSIGATQLNVSGNGSSNQMLVSDGDGSFSWANQPSGGSTVTFSTSTTTFNVSLGDTNNGQFNTSLTNYPFFPRVQVNSKGWADNRYHRNCCIRAVHGTHRSSKDSNPGYPGASYDNRICIGLTGHEYGANYWGRISYNRMTAS